MVDKRVYVTIEGGAPGKQENRDFCRCWGIFLHELREIAHSNGYQELKVIRGLGRSTTYKDFVKRRKRFPDDLHVLLVDSETTVPPNTLLWDVVRGRRGDEWQRPSWATERHIYFMVHSVETWIITDHEALAKYYGRGFEKSKLPTVLDLEDRSKDYIENRLKAATQQLGRKQYKHIHAIEIIQHVTSENVRRLRHGERLFSVFGQLMRNEPE